MEIVGEGAEAKLYSTKIYGVDSLVKSREPKSYRIPQLDVPLRRRRTRKEARIMQKADAAGIRVPKMLGVGEFSIYMERIYGRLLKDGRISAAQARQAGELLAKMHNAGIVHGDFTPANIIAEKGRICVIDFGLSDTMGDVEEKAVDILLMKRSISPQLYACFEKGYTGRSDSGKSILRRLAAVEKRGRYQSRTLI